jgi:hypothetical protein
MIMRWALCFAILLIGLASPAAGQSVVRVFSLDAYATQCKPGVCATIQVTQSRFSNGTSQTILLFTAYDDFGEPLPSPFSAPFVPIDTDLFTVNEEGTVATLSHPRAAVVWQADGSYTEVSSLRTRVRDNTKTPPEAFRLVERVRVHGTLTQGTVGEPGTPGHTIFDTSAVGPDGFASGTVAIRKTFRIELEVAGSSPDDLPDPPLPRALE